MFTVKHWEHVSDLFENFTIATVIIMVASPVKCSNELLGPAKIHLSQRRQMDRMLWFGDTNTNDDGIFTHINK